MYRCMHIYIYIHTYIYMHIYVYVDCQRVTFNVTCFKFDVVVETIYSGIIVRSPYTYIYIYMYVYTHIHIYKYVYVCIYIYVYIYIYTHTSLSLSIYIYIVLRSRATFLTVAPLREEHFANTSRRRGDSPANLAYHYYYHDCYHYHYC